MECFRSRKSRCLCCRRILGKWTPFFFSFFFPRMGKGKESVGTKDALVLVVIWWVWKTSANPFVVLWGLGVWNSERKDSQRLFKQSLWGGERLDLVRGWPFMEILGSFLGILARLGKRGGLGGLGLFPRPRCFLFSSPVRRNEFGGSMVCYRPIWEAMDHKIEEKGFFLCFTFLFSLFEVPAPLCPKEHKKLCNTCNALVLYFNQEDSTRSMTKNGSWWRIRLQKI